MRLLNTLAGLCVLFAVTLGTSPAAKYSGKVLLVSMDGFRHDYLTKENTPHLYSVSFSHCKLR